MDLETIARVPICRTGTYQLETGEVTFTSEDLAAAVAAFENDPAVLAPRVRVELRDDVGEQAHDVDSILAEASGMRGGPALGYADGLRFEGDTLYADLHVPTELAAVMEWAYPARSIEGVHHWSTSTGNEHDFVATGVLLLGESWPGVTTLPDLRELEAEFAAADDTPEVAAAVEGAERVRTLTVSAGRSAQQQIVAAGLNVYDLPSRWYAAEGAGELEGLPESYDVWSWYVTEARVDDDGTLFALVVDDSTGQLWRFDVASVSGSTLTWAEPYEVVIEVVAARGRRRPRPALARWNSRAESRGAPTSAATSTQEVPMTEEQRRAMALALGVSADTSEAELHRIAAERAESPEGEPGDGDGTGDGGGNGEGDGESGNGEGEGAPAEGTPAGEPAGVAARTQTVSAERLAQLEADAAAGAVARRNQVRDERDDVVQAAIDDGRITPAEAGLRRNDDGTYPPGWRADLDTWPEATAAALARLAPARNATPRSAAARTPQTHQDDGGYDRVAASLGIRREPTPTPTPAGR